MSLDTHLASIVEEAVARQLDRLIPELVLALRSQGFEKEFLTYQEAAAMAGVKPKTIGDWVRQGKLSKHGDPSMRPRVSAVELTSVMSGSLPDGDDTIRDGIAARVSAMFE